MRKGLLLLCLLILSFNSFSQNDLLVLKKRNHIIQTWIPGSYIHFQFSNKQWLQGRIKAIKNDSLLIDLMMIRQVGNQFGLPTVDTGRLGLLKIHVKEIYGVPNRSQRSGIISSGILFQVGSAAYMFLNVFNSISHGEQIFSAYNLPRLAIAGGVFAFGTFLGSLHKTYIALGKKYTMEVLGSGK